MVSSCSCFQGLPRSAALRRMDESVSHEHEACASVGSPLFFHRLDDDAETLSLGHLVLAQAAWTAWDSSGVVQRGGGAIILG